MADVRFCSSCRSKMNVRDQFHINCGPKKKYWKWKRDRKSNDKHEVFKWVLEKRQERKNYKVTHKTITAERRKPMFSGNCKTVDGSVAIEVEIMDTSKGSLEPVRGSKLPVKVGKDMTADEVRVFGPKKHSGCNQFFSGLENYVLLYNDPFVMHIMYLCVDFVSQIYSFL